MSQKNKKLNLDVVDVSDLSDVNLFEPIVVGKDFLLDLDDKKPKRPPNKFMIFRKNVKTYAQRKGLSWGFNMKQLTHFSSGVWNNATKEQKQVFENIAKDIKEQ